MFGSTMKISEKIPAELREKVRGPGSLPSTDEKKALAAGVKPAPGRRV